ncbi:MAG: HD domain-containing protein [candidate division WOR-3 bacterium]
MIFAMTKSEAIALVGAGVPNKNLVKHMIACAACMRALAERLGHDPQRWELAGLLHDLDVSETSGDFSKHGLLAVEKLRGLGFDDEEILGAIMAHAEKKPLETDMDRALYAVDPTTGFIVACALMHPSKTLAGLDIGFLKNRFKERRFAAGASREQMASCESLGISLDDFLSLCLSAMREIADELGL